MTLDDFSCRMCMQPQQWKTLVFSCCHSESFYVILAIIGAWSLDIVLIGKINEYVKQLGVLSRTGVGKLRPAGRMRSERSFNAARRHLQKLHLLFWLNTLHDKIFLKFSCRYLTLLLERVPFSPVRLMQTVMVFRSARSVFWHIMKYLLRKCRRPKKKKKKRSKAYNIMKTVKEQNIIQPKTTKTKTKKKKKKKRSKMLKYINKKDPRLSKLRKVLAPGPPWHWNHHWMQGS